MSGEWRFHGSDRAIAFFSTLTRKQRERLLATLRTLADYPVIQTDDVPLRDVSGRRHWQRFCEGFIIEFWLDHAVKEVRVVDVRMY